MIGQQCPRQTLATDVKQFHTYCLLHRWNTIKVDGHDIESLCKAFHDATTVKGQPTCIVAKTFKGKGLPGESFSMDQEVWRSVNTRDFPECIVPPYSAALLGALLFCVKL